MTIDPTSAAAEEKKVPGVESNNPLDIPEAPHDDSERTSSSLDKSEKKGLDQQREMAGAPILPPPLQPNEYDFGLNNLLHALDPASKTMNSSQALAMVSATMMDATTNMLNGWIENLREIQQFKNAAHQIERRRDEMLESIKITQNVQDKNSKDSTDAVQKFAAFALLVSAGVLSVNAGVPTSLVTLAASKIGGLVSAVAPSAVIDGALTSLVSLFGLSFVTQAAMATLRSSPKDEKAFNYAFAENYATRTLQVVHGKEFDTAILTLAGAEGGTISTKSALVKTALLSQSLAFAYQLETGTITGQEFAGLITGKTVLKTGDFRNGLITAIQGQLDLLSPEQKAKVLEKLMEYFDSKPDLKELSEPAAAIRSMFAKPVHVPIAG